MRKVELTRKTAETDISLTLDLDGTGVGTIDTGCGFLNHMLTLFTRHGSFDLTVTCKGDTDVDDHHTAEDIGIVLGKALARCLGDMAGVTRYGQMLLPMDEVLMLCAVDLSGRGHLGWEAAFSAPKIGSFDTELVQEFFLALTRSAQITLHLRALSPGNAHHTAEAMFKAAARALRAAVSIDPAQAGRVPSTKGVLL